MQKLRAPTLLGAGEIVSCCFPYCRESLRVSLSSLLKAISLREDWESIGKAAREH
jgi:hypothetical protein